MKVNYSISSWAGTSIFLISGFSAIAFESLEIIYVILSLGLLCIGITMCSIAFLKSLELSRHQIVTTGDLFLMSIAFPRRDRMTLWSSFAVSLLAGILLPVMSTSTNFAFGILASVYPIGNVNMWAISHGSFIERKNIEINDESDDYE
jgi:hypothetical protein